MLYPKGPKKKMLFLCLLPMYCWDGAIAQFGVLLHQGPRAGNCGLASVASHLSVEKSNMRPQLADFGSSPMPRDLYTHSARECRHLGSLPWFFSTPHYRVTPQRGGHLDLVRGTQLGWTALHDSPRREGPIALVHGWKLPSTTRHPQAYIEARRNPAAEQQRWQLAHSIPGETGASLPTIWEHGAHYDVEDLRSVLDGNMCRSSGPGSYFRLRDFRWSILGAV